MTMTPNHAASNHSSSHATTADDDDAEVLVMDPEEYERFRLDPHSYLGLDDSDEELDIQIVHDYQRDEQPSQSQPNEPLPQELTGHASLQDCKNVPSLSTSNDALFTKQSESAATPDASRNLDGINNSTAAPPSLSESSEDCVLEANEPLLSKDKKDTVVAAVVVSCADIATTTMNSSADDAQRNTCPFHDDEGTAACCAKDASNDSANALEIANPFGAAAPRLVRQGQRLTAASRNVLCQAILDRCSLKTGKLPKSTQQVIADTHSVNVSTVQRIFRCILRSVAATGQVDPNYQMERAKSGLSDINLIEAYAKLQTILKARAGRDDASTAAMPEAESASTAARQPATAACAAREQTKAPSCHDEQVVAAAPLVAPLLARTSSSSSDTLTLQDDICSDEDDCGTLDVVDNGPSAIATNNDSVCVGQDAAQTTSTADESPIAAATGTVSSLKLLLPLARDNRNRLSSESKDLLRQTILDRCSTDGDLEHSARSEIADQFQISIQTVSRTWRQQLHGQRATTTSADDTAAIGSSTMPKYAPACIERKGRQLTEESRHIVAEALMDRCDPTTGKLQPYATQQIAAIFAINDVTVYTIWKRMLASVVATGVVDPSYKKKGAKAWHSDIDIAEAYVALQKVLDKRQSERQSCPLPNPCIALPLRAERKRARTNEDTLAVDEADAVDGRDSATNTNGSDVECSNFEEPLQESFNSDNTSPLLDDEDDDDAHAFENETTLPPRKRRCVQLQCNGAIDASGNSQRRRDLAVDTIIDTLDISGLCETPRETMPTEQPHYRRVSVPGEVVKTLEFGSKPNSAVAVPLKASLSHGDCATAASLLLPSMTAPLDDFVRVLSFKYFLGHQSNERAFRADLDVRIMVHHVSFLLEGSGCIGLSHRNGDAVAAGYTTSVHLCLCDKYSPRNRQCQLFSLFHATDELFWKNFGPTYCTNCR